MTGAALDAALIEAHAAGERAALVRLYAKAADEADTAQAQGFFLTHAYVFALEAGLPEADALRARLQSMGREPPDPAGRDTGRGAAAAEA